MIALLLFSAIAWVYLAPIGSAHPLNGCVDTWDSWGIACVPLKTCDNAPNVVLGQMYNPPSHVKARHLQPREDSVTWWCQIGSETYVELETETTHFAASAYDVSDLIDNSITDIKNNINSAGDGVIGKPYNQQIASSIYPTESFLQLTAYDANNHHLTYGVLGAALEAVRDYMHTNPRNFALTRFKIYDGDNQTGEGSIDEML